MALPLLTSRSTRGGMPLVYIEPADAPSMPAHTERETAAVALFARSSAEARGRMPDRQPGPGEQFRFHVDMTRCIGCKCCVVACNEQNGNPATVHWRRVGEVEGGSFPETRRAYFSMGCNHCADPTCLAGCPTDAYTKDPKTGIVRHDAETCIGCQYCTWTCSYGVPQFNAERGVVGKCDMCYGRLSHGQAPACVSACPEGALAIEIVRVADWRAAAPAGPAPDGRPAGDASLSTTRVTLPAAGLPEAARPIDRDRVRPEPAHGPLVVMTVLTQLAVGAVAAVALANLFGDATRLWLAAALAFAACAAGLGAATLHLGRPIHAYRAMKMWRRSWLSREAVLFAAFTPVMPLYALALWRGWPMTTVADALGAGAAAIGVAALGALTAAFGVAAAFATSRIYFVPSRPSWNTPRTMGQFLLTGAMLGPLAVAAAAPQPGFGLRGAAVAAALAQIGLALDTRRRFAASADAELRAAARLVRTSLAPWFRARIALAAAGGVVIPVLASAPAALAGALVLAAAGELAGRYLFFVTAVPRHMTAPYLAAEREAA